MRQCALCGRMYARSGQTTRCQQCAEQPRPCEFCGETLVLLKNNFTQRFCNQSCASKWKQRQPEFRAKFYTEARAKKISTAKLKWHQDHPEFADTLSSQLKRRNWMIGTRITPVPKADPFAKGSRGGNGRGPTEAEKILAGLLKDESPINNFVIRTGMGHCGYPTHYKADIAIPRLRLVVEADGTSHYNSKARERDFRKDNLLAALGWKVVRFSNRQILKRPTQVEIELRSLISTLKSTTATQ